MPSATDDEFADTSSSGVAASCGSAAKWIGRATATPVVTAVDAVSTMGIGADTRSAVAVIAHVAATNA